MVVFKTSLLNRTGRISPGILVSAFVAVLLFSANTVRAEDETSLEKYTQGVPGTALSFDMVLIPTGTLETIDHNNPETTRTVEIKSIWVATTEVTWDLYDAYRLSTDPENGKDSDSDAVSRPSRPYGAPDRGFGTRGYPVIGITYHAAEQFCKWLSRETGKKFRLPTEDEWEYACIAGGKEIPTDKLQEYAWFWEEKTYPTGKKKANAWGLHDMLGNVAEWCKGFDDESVLRGGSFEDMRGSVTARARKKQTPAWTATDPQMPKSKWWLSDAPFAGFRVVREK